MYVRMYTYVYVCMYVSKQAYVLCETKYAVTVENSELTVRVVKILKILIKFQSSRCSNLIKLSVAHFLSDYLLHTGLCHTENNLITNYASIS